MLEMRVHRIGEADAQRAPATTFVMAYEYLVALLRDPVKRTAALLLRLAGMRSAMCGSAQPSAIYFSREKLGQLVNLSRNSITPNLHAFVKRRCIEVSYGSILIITELVTDRSRSWQTIGTATQATFQRAARWRPRC